MIWVKTIPPKINTTGKIPQRIDRPGLSGSISAPASFNTLNVVDLVGEGTGVGGGKVGCVVGESTLGTWVGNGIGGTWGAEVCLVVYQI
jgi:hypothetical protein